MTRPRGRTAGTRTERCPQDEEAAERGVPLDETRAVSRTTHDMDDTRGEPRRGVAERHSRPRADRVEARESSEATRLKLRDHQYQYVVTAKGARR